MDIDDYVETSDIEEQEEILPVEGTRNYGVSLALWSTPPRKRAKLFHHEEGGDANSLRSLFSATPEGTQNGTPSQSQSSSTMFNATSPSLFTPPQSRYNASDPHQSPITKETTGLFAKSYSPLPDSSQDPLLLQTPPRTRNAPLDLLPRTSPNQVSAILSSPNVPHISTTPSASPPGPRQYQTTGTPITPLRAPVVYPTRTTTPDGESDELLMFSPQKPEDSGVDPLPSVTSSSPSASQLSEREFYSLPNSGPASPTNSQFHRSLSPPSPSAPPLSPTAHEISIADILQQERRYPLRQRNYAQKHPYTFDQLNYKQQLKANPEAIVKWKHLNRNRDPTDHYEEEEETQEDGFIQGEGQGEDGDWEERRRRRQRDKSREPSADGTRGSGGEGSIQFPEILQDLETDDEEAKLQAMSKEAKKYLREKEKQKRAKEREAREREMRERREKEKPQTKPKRFPIARPQNVASPLPSSDNEMNTMAEPSRVARRGSSEARQSQQSRVNDQELLEYFGQEDLEMAVQEDEPIADFDSFESNVDMTVPHESPRRFHRSQSGSPDVSDEGPGDEIVDLSSLSTNQRRALDRMMPRFMINALAKGVPPAKMKSKPQDSSTPPGSEQTQGPVLPGQTRTRRTENLKDAREIRGDSESEPEVDDHLDSGSDLGIADGYHSNSDTMETGSPFRSRRLVRRPEIIEIEDSSSSEADDLDDDADIQAHLNDNDDNLVFYRDTGTGNERQYDYMLQKASNIGRTRKRKKRRESQQMSWDGPARPKLDILTRGARGHGREHQTLLSFEGHSTKQGGGYRPKTMTTFARSARRRDIGGDGEDTGSPRRRRNISENTNGGTTDRADPPEMTWKERQRWLRAQAKKRSVHMFASEGGARISSGRSKAYMTLTLESEQPRFTRVLHPPARRRRDLLPPAQSHRFPNTSIHGEETQTHQDVAEESEVEMVSGNNSKTHFVIKVLSSGLSFPPCTSIRKGLLQDLIHVVTSVQNAVQPPPTIARGFDIAAAMGPEEFSDLLHNICEAVIDFVSDLPNPDEDMLANEWLAIMRATPRLLSWFLKTADEANRESLRKRWNQEISQLVSKISNMDPMPTGIPALMASWFCVDMGARLGQPIEMLFSGLLESSISLSLRLLLQVNLLDIMEFVQSTNSEPSELAPAGVAAEMWVNLIHLLSVYVVQENPQRQIHPFWSQVTKVLANDTMTESGWNDYIWQITFSLCALSQFSVHGMTTSQPRLPACWTLVTLAFKHIQQKISPTIDSRRKKDDLCIAVSIIRCVHLQDHWNWKMDDASVLFNRLADLFRSRKFGKLVHERAPIPKFFAYENQDVFSTHVPEDTAYVRFLKLIVRAAEEAKAKNNDQLTPAIKKIFSLTVPVSSIPVPPNNKIGEDEKAMFQNRLSAAAIIIHLEPSQYDSRMKQARGYLNFTNRNNSTRVCIIKGMTTLALLFVKTEARMDGIAIWVEEMAEILGAEIAACPDIARKNIMADKTEDANAVRKTIMVTVELIKALSLIVEQYASQARYPEPKLLLNLRHVFTTWLFAGTDHLKNATGLLIDNFLKARSLAIPPPERPPPPPAAQEEESQDYDNLGFDLNDVDWSRLDLPEALAGVGSKAMSKDEVASNDVILSEGIQKCKNFTSRFLRRYLSPPKPGEHVRIHEEQLDMWLNCWLGCKFFEPGPRTWLKYIDGLPYTSTTSVEENRTSAIKLSIMLKILKMEPMTYLASTDRCIEIFLQALVSGGYRLEKDYIAFLLSIGGLQHPLLADVSCLPPRQLGDFEFSKDEYLALRIPLLRVVFANVNRALESENMINIDGFSKDTYIELCIMIFKAMRRIVLALPQTDPAHATYTKFCFEVVEAFSQWPAITKVDRLKFWADWGRQFSPTVDS